MSYTRALEQKSATVQLLSRILVGAFAVIVLLLLLIHQARQNVRVDVRPGLSSRVVVSEGQMPAENAFSFALIVFQQMNRWREDGARDYPAQIERVRAFLTDRYKGQALADADRRKKSGELQYRTRHVALPPEISFKSDRVKKISDSLWIVYLDLDLQETVRGQVVKTPVIRYPVRVIAADVDPQYNPYGLLIDGFAEEPRRLADDELKQLGIVRKGD